MPPRGTGGGHKLTTRGMPTLSLARKLTPKVHMDIQKEVHELSHFHKVTSRQGEI